MVTRSSVASTSYQTRLAPVEVPPGLTEAGPVLVSTSAKKAKSPAVAPAVIAKGVNEASGWAKVTLPLVLT